MPQGKTEKVGFFTRPLRIILAAATLVACVLFSYTQAFADFTADSAGETIGVGRIQSSTPAVSGDTEPAARFATPQLASEPTDEAASVLAQPVERGLATEDAEEIISNLNDIQRFGEPDAAGWYTTQASAYGPSSAGRWTATGTELTLESADVAIRIDCLDLMGRTIEIMYGGQIIRAKIVDNGTLAPGRLLDFQPGLCTAFGAETPEFGWGVRTVKWRLV